MLNNSNEVITFVFLSFVSFLVLYFLLLILAISFMFLTVPFLSGNFLYIKILKFSVKFLSFNLVLLYKIFYLVNFYKIKAENVKGQIFVPDRLEISQVKKFLSDFFEKISTEKLEKVLLELLKSFKLLDENFSEFKGNLLKLRLTGPLLKNVQKEKVLNLANQIVDLVFANPFLSASLGYLKIFPFDFDDENFLLYNVCYAFLMETILQEGLKDLKFAFELEEILTVEMDKINLYKICTVFEILKVKSIWTKSKTNKFYKFFSGRIPFFVQKINILEACISDFIGKNFSNALTGFKLANAKSTVIVREFSKPIEIIRKNPQNWCCVYTLWNLSFVAFNSFDFPHRAIKLLVPTVHGAAFTEPNIYLNRRAFALRLQIFFELLLRADNVQLTKKLSSKKVSLILGHMSWSAIKDLEM